MNGPHVDISLLNKYSNCHSKSFPKFQPSGQQRLNNSKLHNLHKEHLNWYSYNVVRQH